VAIVGAYPGTFNPPTIAHLAIAEAAVRQGRLDRLDLVVSLVPLGKEVPVPPFEDRVSVLEAIAATRPWLGVRVTEHQLISDVAAGYDAVVLGADKWLQVIDPIWYGGTRAARDEAVARLPRLVVVARPPHLIPEALPEGSILLEVGADHAGVSSTAARAGRREWMAAEAALSGRWVDGQPDSGERAD
jgi:hypothetical protein